MTVLERNALRPKLADVRPQRWPSLAHNAPMQEGGLSIPSPPGRHVLLVHDVLTRR